MTGPKPIPEAMYLLFERGLFLGAFEKWDAAARWLEAREKGGHGPHEIHEFIRTDRTVAMFPQCEIRRCLGSRHYHNRGEIHVTEIVGDGAYLALICRPCADAIGVREGDDLPDYDEVLKRLKRAKRKQRKETT